LKANPGWVYAFPCGEGCFPALISLARKPFQSTWGILVQLEETLPQSLMDEALLEAIQNFLGVGYLYKKHSNIGQDAVLSRKDLLKIRIPYF
jgi:hypothetical protein